MKKSGRIGFRVEPDVKVQWEKTAKEQGISLSAWIEYCCATIQDVQNRASTRQGR